MHLPQNIINKAYDLHYLLVESYKTLNEHLLEPTLSDEERINYYMTYFSTCEEVRESVIEIISLLNELKAQCFFSLFKKFDTTTEDFLAIVYDKRNFEKQEDVRRTRDSFVKSVSLPFYSCKHLTPTLHFRDNSFLVINTKNRQFKTLFQKSIEKARDFLLENKLKIEIAATKENTTLTDEQKEEVIHALVKKTKFKHPFFLNKYRGNSASLRIHPPKTSLSLSDDTQSSCAHL